MKAKMLSLLAAVAMFGAVSAASAAEPITLSEAQMDAVSAGGTSIGNFANQSLAAVGAVNVGGVGSAAVGVGANAFVF